jgi:hypothetical protein
MLLESFLLLLLGEQNTLGGDGFELNSIDAGSFCPSHEIIKKVRPSKCQVKRHTR